MSRKSDRVCASPPIGNRNLLVSLQFNYSAIASLKENKRLSFIKDLVAQPFASKKKKTEEETKLFWTKQSRDLFCLRNGISATVPASRKIMSYDS